VEIKGYIINYHFFIISEIFLIERYLLLKMKQVSRHYYASLGDEKAPEDLGEATASIKA
jgi:hypothetical protein